MSTLLAAFANRIKRSRKPRFGDVHIHCDHEIDYERLARAIRATHSL